MVDLDGLLTEGRNPNTMNLDEMSPLEIAKAMNEEDQHVALAVKRVLPEVAKAIEWGRESLSLGGRIIYFGAGTSGRLGVLDAAECPPTFGVSPNTVVGLIAGGNRAVIGAVEGAEDDCQSCVRQLDDIGLDKRDLAVGIAASGRTPYVLGGIRHANGLGCNTVAITCNAGSEIGKVAKLAIEVETGPEVLAGSTRLKAGTAQKMILNMISTGVMVGIGKAYQNLMVDMVHSNEKLCSRAASIVCAATGCDADVSFETLDQANGHVKEAIVMLLCGCDFEEASRRLTESRGHVRKAVAGEAADHDL